MPQQVNDPRLGQPQHRVMALLPCWSSTPTNRGSPPLLEERAGSRPRCSLQVDDADQLGPGLAALCTALAKRASSAAYCARVAPRSEEVQHHPGASTVEVEAGAVELLGRDGRRSLAEERVHAVRAADLGDGEDHGPGRWRPRRRPRRRRAPGSTVRRVRARAATFAAGAVGVVSHPHRLSEGDGWRPSGGGASCLAVARGSETEPDGRIGGPPAPTGEGGQQRADRHHRAADPEPERQQHQEHAERGRITVGGGRHVR